MWNEDDESEVKTRMMMMKHWTWEWVIIRSNQICRESHVNNECNDGMDDDPELLRESHSSHSQNIWQKWIQRMKGLGKLAYELSSTNILNEVTLKYQYTRPMMENTMHIHTCAYFSFLFIHHFFYIYTNAHPLNINKWAPNMISTMDRHTLKTLSNEMTFSN